MLDYKDKGIIFQIVKYCERIESKTKKISKEQFDSEIDLREVICFNLFQIGELANHLSDRFVSEYSYVPWKQIKGMRNRIVHGYNTIDFDIVWETAKTSVVELRKNCESIIK